MTVRAIVDPHPHVCLFHFGSVIVGEHLVKVLEARDLEIIQLDVFLEGGFTLGDRGRFVRYFLGKVLEVYLVLYLEVVVICVHNEAKYLVNLHQLIEVFNSDGWEC